LEPDPSLRSEGVDKLKRIGILSHPLTRRCDLASSGARSDQANRGGRPPKLTREQVEVLAELVRKNPLLALDDLVGAFRRRTGIRISAPTIKKYLMQAGFTRSAGSPPSDAEALSRVERPATRREAGSASYGYRAAHRDSGDSVRYPCGLTDSEWEQVKHLFDPPGRTGRPEKYPRRQMLDACVYVLRSGCSWRMLPKDFPAWPAVYRTFRRWQGRGLFESLYDELRMLWRSREHRAPDPTAVILDSQSVRSSPQGGPTGYDAAKKIKGRKRHLVTDTLGLLVAVLVTAANVQDRDAAMAMMELATAKAPGIKMLYADSGYGGTRAEEIRQRHDTEVEIVRNPGSHKVGQWHEGQLPLFDVPAGFRVLPKRWIIERTNAWNDRPRRMNKDHDRNPAVSSSWIWLTEARMLLRRITTEPEHFA
jgi:transposase